MGPGPAWRTRERRGVGGRGRLPRGQPDARGAAHRRAGVRRDDGHDARRASRPQPPAAPVAPARGAGDVQPLAQRRLGGAVGRGVDRCRRPARVRRRALPRRGQAQQARVLHREPVGQEQQAREPLARHEPAGDRGPREGRRAAGPRVPPAPRAHPLRRIAPRHDARRVLLRAGAQAGRRGHRRRGARGDRVPLPGPEAAHTRGRDPDALGRGRILGPRDEGAHARAPRGAGAQHGQQAPARRAVRRVQPDAPRAAHDLGFAREVAQRDLPRAHRLSEGGAAQDVG